MAPHPTAVLRRAVGSGALHAAVKAQVDPASAANGGEMAGDLRAFQLDPRHLGAGTEGEYMGPVANNAMGFASSAHPTPAVGH
jgi:hypothetical protein